MNKKLLVIIIILLVFLTIPVSMWTFRQGPIVVPEDTVPSGTQVPKPANPVQAFNNAAIFYIPHPDDEVLSMGAAILEAKNHHNPVILVLLTRGTASKAFQIVNDRLDSSGLPPIDIEEFGNARIRDFRESAKHLGIPSKNVFIFDLTDSQVTSADVKEIILAFEKIYPGALHQTMSFDDPHHDHAAAGAALKELQIQKAVDSPRFIIPLQIWDLYPTANITKSTSLKNIEEYKMALNAYLVWNPSEGRYSISFFSTQSSFEFAETLLESHWVFN